MKVGNYKVRWEYEDHFNTICDIVNSQNKIIASGIAICNPCDHFCRDTGRKISLARALKDAKLSKDERKVVWEIYRNQKPNKRW